MTTYQLTFDLSSHQLINANVRLHWREDRKRSRDLRAVAGWQARAARIPGLTSARIVARVTWPDARRRDAHNLGPTGKHLIDGLVDAGVLPDDSDRHLIGPDWRTTDEPLPRSQWLVAGTVPTTRIVLEITDTG